MSNESSDGIFGKIKSKAFDQIAELAATVVLVPALASIWAVIPEKQLQLAIDYVGPKKVFAAFAVFLVGNLYFALKWKKSKNNILNRVRVVPGRGYSVDPKNGEVVCPRCLAEGQASYMMLTGRENHAYLCHACSKAIPK